MSLDAARLGRWIRGKREALGLVQRELAELVGVDITVVQRWERGETMPRAEHLYALTLALGATADELLRAAAGPPRRGRRRRAAA